MRKTYKASDLFHTSWDTLSKKQLLQLLQLQTMLMKEKDADKQAYIKTHMLWAINRNKKLYKQITSAQMVDLFAELDFLKEPTTRWFVPSFHHNGFKFYAPMQELKGFQLPGDKEGEFTFAKLMYADSYYTIFLLNSQEEYFWKFASHLYMREPSKHGKKITMEDMQMIVINYAANRDAVFSRFKHLFPKDQPSDPEISGELSEEVPVKPTGQMWQSLLYSLADTPAFSGIDNAKNAVALEALSYLDQKAKEAEEMKRKLKARS